MDMDFLKESVEYYEKALTIDGEVYGEKHPSVAIDLNNLGSAWDSVGDSKKAVEYFVKASQIFHEALGLDHP
jgi:tetratricopeptide (TPR) repeat protein